MSNELLMIFKEGKIKRYARSSEEHARTRTRVQKETVDKFPHVATWTQMSKIPQSCMLT